VDPNRPKTKRFTYGEGVRHTEKPGNVGQESETHNSFLLVQSTPSNRTFKVLPLHLFSATTGIASPQIRKVVDGTIEFVISADTWVKIALIRVDGDEGLGRFSLYAFQKSNLV
jgi:hypothetical protein